MVVYFCFVIVWSAIEVQDKNKSAKGSYELIV